VMVATSGDLLIQKSAVVALCKMLIPLAMVVTPNIPEAEAVTGMKLRTSEDIQEAARRIVKLGAQSVVIKGGHRSGPAVDFFYDGKKLTALHAPRIRTQNTHGTGCTFSAAIAAYLAKGEKLDRAVAHSKQFITRAIRSSFPIGAGHSPVHHFHGFWKNPLD